MPVLTVNHCDYCRLYFMLFNGLLFDLFHWVNTNGCVRAFAIGVMGTVYTFGYNIRFVEAYIIFLDSRVCE